MLPRNPKPVIVVVTAPDRKTARQLANAALRQRLVACANIIPAVESHYWWQGKLEKSAELLILFKTTSARLRELERTVIKLHPYETPEFVAIRPASATPKYLAWWLAACEGTEA